MPEPEDDAGLAAWCTLNELEISAGCGAGDVKALDA